MPRGNKKYQASIRMPESMWKAIVEASARSGISAMEYMRRAIQKELDHDKDHDKKGKDDLLLTEEQTRALIREEIGNVEEIFSARLEEALNNLQKENSLEIGRLQGLIEEQQNIIINFHRMIQKDE